MGPSLSPKLPSASIFRSASSNSILLELKNQGVLRSKKGKGGGYILSKPPDLLSVGHVLRMLEGPGSPALRQQDRIREMRGVP